MSINLSILMTRLGYQFSNKVLLEQALSHRSVGKNNNERLEFLGDSILNFVITDALFARFPETPEGQLSQMRARLVKGKTLAAIARELSLGDCLLLGPGELKSGGHRRESILADTVEALIGAIYVESGLTAAREAVLHWFGDRLDEIEPSEHANKDAKTQLQERLQARKAALPVYTLINTVGSEHQQRFQVQCDIALLKQQFHGEGSSRRVAEQMAAKLALAALIDAGY